MAASTKTGSGDEKSCLPAPLLWAQRKDKVWITVVLENCKDGAHALTEQTFSFKGTGGTENLKHEVDLTLFGEIVPDKSTCQKSDRQAFYTLAKKDTDAPYWPRLIKEQKKLHYLKTDFNRWKDEDDSEDEGAQEEKEDFNLDAMMNSMGGLNGAGGPGAFMGMGGPEAEAEGDSDDEDLPDLQ